MVSFTVKLEGFSEFEKALSEELPKATSRTVLNRTGKQALQQVADRMAELAPYDPEDRDGNGRHLKDTMKVQIASAKQARAIGISRKEGVVVLAGPAPEGRAARAAAASLERGTGERFQKTTGKSVGFLPAQPFARPAADQTAVGVFDTVKVRLAAEIERAKKRIARKAARLAAKGGRGG